MLLKKAKTYTSLVIGIVIAGALCAAVLSLTVLDFRKHRPDNLPSDYVYSIEDTEAIPEELKSYKKSAIQYDTGFVESRGIAVDSKGNLYVAGDKAVHIFNQQGQITQKVKLNNEPGALCVYDNKIYVCLKNSVSVYDLNSGEFTDWDEENDKAFFTSIGVDKDNVFIADAGNRIVIRYDNSGRKINYIGAKDKERNIPGFVIPSPHFDIAIADDGLLRVVNPGRHNIEAYTYRGDLEFSWGHYSTDIEGFCGCCNPVSLSILSDGRFVTSEKGLTRIKIYDIEGKFESVVAGPDELLENADNYKLSEFPQNARETIFDLATMSEAIYVLDSAKNRIMKFKPEQL
jgi:hypothetical protein